MSLCRGRLYFEAKAERRSGEFGVPQTLTFDDSDLEEEDVASLQGVEVSGRFTRLTADSPVRNKSLNLWDSGIGSPTPGSTPMKYLPSPTRGENRPSPRRPLPFSTFCESHGDDSDEEHSPIPPAPPTPNPFTPPHKKFRSLRLNDTPHTPKSLLQRAHRRATRASRNRSESRGMTPGGSENLNQSLKIDPEGPQANVNPFTSDLVEKPCSLGIKRARSVFNSSNHCEDSLDEEVEMDMPCNKKLALHEINTSRYNEEFYEVCKLGVGEFGSVYKCINRLDGCTYAIKKSKTPVAGSVYERNALNEVYAHAVLGKHQHVVRYYSAWAENDHMYIQNEYCNGGCLADVVSENRRAGLHFSEAELKVLLLQLAQGLRYIHSQHLVHLDIKPGNVFIHHNPRHNSPESGLEEDLCDEEEEPEEEQEPVTYKIGDLGHVTSVGSPQVEEGDSRYLANEVLQERLDCLPKADIFSLALTVYVAAGGEDLPKNGSAWHAIRKGHLPELEHCSTELNMLLKSMVDADPHLRPTATSLTQNMVLCPYAKKSRAQLRRELNQERFKNEILLRQLEEAKQKQRQVSEPDEKDRVPAKLQPPKTRSSRLIGRKVNRSMSLNVF